VYPWTYGIHSQCCQGVVYNYSADSCCGGLKPRLYGGSTGCCGWRLYNQDTEICCHLTHFPRDIAVIRPKLYSNRTFCCHDEVYHIQEHMCCGGKVYHVDRNQHICCGGQPRDRKFGMDTLCCGTSVYRYCADEDCDPDEPRWCCGGQLSNIDFGVYTGCCGTSVYNTKLQFCCNDTVYPRDGDLSCCYSSLFNLTTSWCCQGNITDRAPGRRLGCCGTEAYDQETQLCCVGAVAVVYREFGYDTGCCGTAVFDSKKFLCCNDKLYPRLQGRSCCPGSNKVYNYETQLCCNGVVLNREFGDHSGCCGTSVIDNDKFYCCWPNRNVAELTQLQLWLVEPYRKLDQQCCDGVVVNLASRDERCCGTRVYNINTETCCSYEFLAVADSACDPHRSAYKAWIYLIIIIELLTPVKLF